MRHPCGRYTPPPLTRREMLVRCLNGFGAVALSALAGAPAAAPPPPRAPPPPPTRPPPPPRGLPAPPRTSAPARAT